MSDAFCSGSVGLDKESRPDGGRMPDIRVDHGASCMVRYNGVVLPSSKTGHILSRYRPIAPKPLAIKPGESAGSAPSDPQSSSTLSFERTSSKAASASSDGSRGKRTRKRFGTDYLTSPRRPAKRGSARAAVRVDKLRTVSCKSTAVIGGIEKAVEQFSPDKSGLQQQKPPVGGFLPLKEGPVPTCVTEMAPTDTRSVFTLPGPGRVDRRKHVFGGFGPSGVGKLTPQTIVESRLGSDLSPGVACMSESCLPNCDCPANRRSNLGAPMNAFQKTRTFNDTDGHCQMAGACRCDASGSCESSLRGRYYAQLATRPSFSNSFGESEVISDADSRKTNLVTLSLLPDTPSHECNSPEAPRPNCKTLPFLPLAMGIDMRSWEAETKEESPNELHKLTLFSKDFASEAKQEEVKRSGLSEDGRQNSWQSSSTEKQPHALEGRSLPGPLARSSGSGVSFWGADDRSESMKSAVIDSSHMEQAYLASSDPVMLTEEGNVQNVLWANHAFKRAATERNSGKDKEIGGPYLDPLGIATQLSSFSYQPPQGLRTKAVLWGFLKKFMMPETNGASLIAVGREGDDRKPTQDKKFSVNLDQEYSVTFQSSHPKPITPQPLRPVGSTLTVESVDSMNHYSSPITENLESVKEQLESAAVPCVITDYRNRVRWVNAAYKQMVGQPECPWLASTMAKKTTRETSQNSRLTGEVVLTCNEPLSQLTAIFCCRVHVQWTNQGEEKSITVPTEVTRIDSERVGNMYVWKLDILSTDLRLQNGKSRQHDA